MKITSHSLWLALAALWCMAMPAAAQEIRISAEECRRMAEEASSQLKRADLAVRQAEYDRRIANVQRLPKLEATAMGIYMYPDMDMMGMKSQMHGAYLAGLQLTQPIYAGGKITAGRRLARVGQRVAEEQARMDRMDVALNALQSYWTYIAVLDKVRLAERYHAMIDTVYAQTAVAVEAGMASDNDLLRISAKRSEIVYQGKKARNGAELCRLALCNAIGADFSATIIPTDTLAACAPQGSLVPDISARPELSLLECQLEASRHQVKMALGDFLPTVGLSLGYNWYGNIKMKGMTDIGGGTMVPYTMDMKDNLGMAMLAVQVPLFHWGEGAKKVRKAKLEVERSALELEDKSKLLELDARQAALNLEDGWELIQSATVSLEQAVENLRVMQNRYDASMATLTDLLDAQNQWHQAQSDMIEAKTQYRINEAEWLRATGRL